MYVCIKLLKLKKYITLLFDRISSFCFKAVEFIVCKPAIYFIWDNTGIPHFIALYFIELHRYYIFHKLKVCGNPALRRSVGAVFPTVFAHFLSCSHVWYFLPYFRLFLLFVIVICDQGYFILLFYNCLGNL